MSALQFTGDLPFFPGLAVAAIASLAAWILYRRQLRGLESTPWIACLPWLRAAVVFFLCLMLTGPVLKVRTVSGSLTRLLIFVDSSQSMGVSDQEMDTVRKLAAARALGWLPPCPAATHAEAAADLLAGSIRSLRKTLSTGQLREIDMHSALDAFFTEMQGAIEPLRNGTFSRAELDEADRLLITPTKRLSTRFKRSSQASVSIPKELLELLDVAARWQMAAAQKARALAVNEIGGDKKISSALSRFDQTSRMERARALLLEGGPESLLSHLSSNFEIELLALEGNRSRLLWKSSQGKEEIPPALPSADFTVTNIGSAILERVDFGRAHDENAARSRAAVILLSDGQHNSQDSPDVVAKMLGDRGIPLYTIGFGSEVRPADMAVLSIEAPQTIFHEDRVSGTVTIKDDMPAGLPFELKIMHGEQEVWRKDMISSQRAVLKVPFDFPAKDLVASEAALHPAQKNIIPLPLEASITPLPREREIRNNSMRFIVKATTGKRKLLLIDGRPRWETRYIRSLFERDPQWQVHTLISDPEGKVPWPRGNAPGAFPADEKTLSEYDMIIFGDVPQLMLGDAELEWLVSFVSERGGGFLFLDGARQNLSTYGSKPLSRLMPVSFESQETAGPPGPAHSLELTERGRTAAAFKLEDTLADPSVVWTTLSPPKRLTHSTALPGSETLLEAITSTGRHPAIVIRQHGAGHVGYIAFDETWRWRNEVAGKYQERFWSQLVNQLAEPAFASNDEQLALDTDAFSYAPGLTAGLRVRIRDGKTRASIDGVLWKDGKKHASVRLIPEPGRPNTFSGRSAPLEAGMYDFGIDDPSLPSSPSSRVRFEVQTPYSGELAELTLNEELLTKLAADSHGKYLREERIADLPTLIEGLKTGHAQESEILLWQSFGWFGLVLSLLTVEWILRKRLGLV